MEARQQAAIALNRFGLGARPGDLERVADDARGWLLAQLQPETELPAPLAALPHREEDQRAFGQWLRRAVRESQQMPVQAGMGEDEAAPTGVEAAYVREFVPRYERALAARFQTAVTTDRPFFERLVHFWSNHFVVSAAKPTVIALPPSFEREVVRPHVTGRFVDMLLASTRHPAMLVYLDNHVSIGPGSRRAARASGGSRRPSGLNENLAREILELHTLGVDGGYTQEDVTSFARALTGWRVERAAFVRRKLFRTDGFWFDGRAHEPGEQRILGRVYAQEGEAQAEAVLRDLARAPATARHVATKLARHFVADDPPAALVTRLERAFREGEGDLSVVARAVVEAPEAWQPDARKLKRPEELLISASRALGAPPFRGRQLHGMLAQLGGRPYWAPSPAGFSDEAGDWLGADAVWKRLQWAHLLTRRLAVSPSLEAAVELGDAVLGPALRPETRAAVEAAGSPAAGLALVLASPEFQRR